MAGRPPATGLNPSCKPNSAKRNAPIKGGADFGPAGDVALKLGPRSHPQKATVILSGCQFQTLLPKHLRLELRNRTRFLETGHDHPQQIIVSP